MGKIAALIAPLDLAGRLRDLERAWPYFEEAVEEPEGESFRELLGTLLRVRYPVEGVLPIGGHYADIPWLLFRSPTLAALRARRFTGRVMLASRAFNVLNLILAQEEA